MATRGHHNNWQPFNHSYNIPWSCPDLHHHHFSIHVHLSAHTSFPIHFPVVSLFSSFAKMSFNFEPTYKCTFSHISILPFSCPHSQTSIHPQYYTQSEYLTYSHSPILPFSTFPNLNPPRLYYTLRQNTVTHSHSPILPFSTFNPPALGTQSKYSHSPILTFSHSNKNGGMEE